MQNPGKTQYPSIIGRDIYRDRMVQDLVNEIIAIPGFIFPDVIQELWNRIEELVDLTDYPPKGKHPFNRLAALQRMFVDIQNVFNVRSDKTREELTKECNILPRTFLEIERHKDLFELLIDALERGGGKAKG